MMDKKSEKIRIAYNIAKAFTNATEEELDGMVKLEFMRRAVIVHNLSKNIFSIKRWKAYRGYNPYISNFHLFTLALRDISKLNRAKFLRWFYGIRF